VTSGILNGGACLLFLCLTHLYLDRFGTETLLAQFFLKDPYYLLVQVLPSIYEKGAPDFDLIFMI
jgi:hypothetical protein